MQEQSGHFTGKGGVRIFYRSWIPEQPVGSLLLAHGLSEHLGRYLHVARHFAGEGFAVHAVDHRGHGQSEGPRCFVNQFDDYLYDLHTFATTIAGEQGKPVMVGHSMGGLIAFYYALKYPETIRALVLSSPWFETRAQVPALKKAAAGLLSRLLPRLQMATEIRLEFTTRNQELVRSTAQDPLYGRTVTPRWFVECTRAVQGAQAAAAGLTVPVLFLVAGDDHLVSPEAARAVFERVPLARKAFKLYPDKYHEIFNDPGNEEVFADLQRWLTEQELSITL